MVGFTLGSPIYGNYYPWKGKIAGYKIPLCVKRRTHLVQSTVIDAAASPF